MSRIYKAPPVKGKLPPKAPVNKVSAQSDSRGRNGSVHNPSVHSPFKNKPPAEDFQTKLARLRAKVDEASSNPNAKPKFEVKSNYKVNNNNKWGAKKDNNNNNNNNNVNNGNKAKPSSANIETKSNMQSLGLKKSAGPKRQWKKLNASKAARAAGRNEEAIKVNLDSIRSKVKFGRLVVYSVNCLANLAENRFNCESIVEQGGITTAKDVIKNHKGNPAVMKEMSRMLTNVAKSNPEYAQQIADDGLLEQCLDVLKTNPRECGVYALEIIDSVLKNSKDSKKVADRLLKAGGLDILTSALKNHMDNPELASAIIQTLNLLSATDPNVGKILGATEIYKPIMDAMKMHPGDGKLAINGTQALARLAALDPRYMQAIKDYGAVGIISNCMQANPDLKQLKIDGAAALKLLAGQDDITKALNVLFNYDKYDNVMITQALGLLANLALITQNADYISTKGGLDALMGLINFKSKNKDLSPEDIEVLANAIRATGRLLQKPANAIRFQKSGGVDKLAELLNGHSDEETIVNAVMDALQNLAQTKEGQKAILDSGIMLQATKVLQDNPDYAVMMQKYADLVKNLPIQDRSFIQPLVDNGMLQAIQKCLLANYDDPDTVMATTDLMKDLAELHPYLAHALVSDNAQGLIQAIRANQDDPEVLKHIFDAIHALAAADPNALAELKKAGLEDTLLQILKKDGVSDEVAAVVKGFYDSLANDGIEADLTQILATLNGLGMPLDDIGQNIQESEVKEDPQMVESGTTWTDPNVVLNGLKEISGLLNDPGFAKQFVGEGQVGNVLDNIQTFYTDPNVVVPALDVLTKCAQVPGVFPLLEEAGVVEGVIQCMLEHPDDQTVQYAGLRTLSALASHMDPMVTESICQPINIETALKALNGNIKDPNTVMAFADLISNLMDDQQNAPQIAQMLASEGVVDALTLALNAHPNNPNVQSKVNQALSKLNPYLFNPDINQHGAQVNPYGTISLAQLSQMTPEELQKLMSGWDHDELTTFMRGAREPKLVTSAANEIDQRLKGGDGETYNAVVSGGGIGDLLGQANNNFDNPMALGACLDALGTLSGDDRLKTLLGMHGTIRLILECIRRHPNDLELLDKCCYILSNLSFNNAQNMTSIIELGGVNDIVGVLKKNKEVNFVCESSINVLVNLCHNSDKNKILICRSGGAKATIAALKQHNRCTKEGDEPVVVSAFRCLANLAYAPENVKSLIKQDTVAVVMDTMNHNTDHRDLIQMGVVVLANLSAHERTAAQMVQLGVLDLIIRVSESYEDELEIQRSCLGCVGNLMNEQSNAVAFLDKKGHKRIFAIMEDLSFEESVVAIALKLLKVLSTNSDIATSIAIDGGILSVMNVMKDNKNSAEILSLGCQALCKLVCTMEGAKHCVKTGLVDCIVEVSKENNNWANIQIMNELVKVVVNFSGVEENAQPYSRSGAVPLLRAIEAHGNNPIFLNNAAMALSKLSIHPASSRPLVKRGAIPVIIQSCSANAQRRGIVTRYIRALTNFLYTEHKTGEELSKVQGYEVLSAIVQQHQDYPQLMTEWQAFEKAMKLKSKKYAPSSAYSVPTRDKMQMANSRLILAGTIMKKYDPNGKSKKRLVRGNDDCTLIVFEDPNGKKAPKQLNMKSVKEIRSGNKTKGLENARPDCSLALISIDPNGREFGLGLETKSSIEAQRWVSALEDMRSANQNPNQSMGGSQMNMMGGSQMSMASS